MDDAGAWVHDGALREDGWARGDEHRSDVQLTDDGYYDEARFRYCPDVWRVGLYDRVAYYGHACYGHDCYYGWVCSLDARYFHSDERYRAYYRTIRVRYFRDGLQVDAAVQAASDLPCNPCDHDQLRMHPLR